MSRKITVSDIPLLGIPHQDGPFRPPSRHSDA
jgi:hypothetical protein